MSGNLKKFIYIIGTICVVFVVGSVLIKLLPWLILIGLISYAGVMISGLIKKKNKINDSEKIRHNTKTENDYNTSSDDYTSGEVIDVEYEDVEKKRD